jgi:hypothetical protein
VTGPDADRRTVYFVGPSLPDREVRALDPDAIILPPAVHGDVYRAASDGARTIVVVDGLFEAVRAIWHKEILWAIDRSCRVIGAASMGALRAAECEAFGMEPVGRIADDYVSGRRTSDGDVAVLHGWAEDGWIALSEPIVNIDATLARLSHHGLLADEEVDGLRCAARSIFYPDRTWARVVAVAVESRSISRGRAVSVLRDGCRLRVDQKAIDARLAVRRAVVRRDLRRPAFEFASTSYWRLGVEALGDLSRTCNPPAGAPSGPSRKGAVP